MHDREPADYLAQRIRELVAADDGQLGIQIEVTPELLILRGPVDSLHRRDEVLATVTALAEGRRIIDELDVPAHDPRAPVRGAERIVP